MWNGVKSVQVRLTRFLKMLLKLATSSSVTTATTTD